MVLNTEDVVGERYTGPFISNNKFQTSVMFGDQAPLGVRDSNSRLHDTSYAYFGDDMTGKMAADSIYNKRQSVLPGINPLIGNVVQYGNALGRSASNIVGHGSEGFRLAGLPGAFLGLVYGGAENAVQLYDYVLHGDEKKKEILELEKSDPYPDNQIETLHNVESLRRSKGILRKRDESLKVEVPLRVGPTKSTEYFGPAETASPQLVYKSMPSDQSSVFSPFQWVDGGEIKSMAKKSKAVVVRAPKAPKPKQKNKRNKAPKSTPMAGMSNMRGAVTSITTAPIAIGNSVRGVATQVVHSGKNVCLRGRDFMFAPVGTGSVTTWTMCGATPLTPAAFADTTLANYMRLYAKFRFKWITVHYITSSPTSANGDVMFYYGKDRSSVYLNQTSTQLLGFVMSDPSTVIGPQWTNHSATLKMTGDWKLTDYGMHDGLEEYADGELFLLSKTSTTDSPGYVLFDYEIEFAQHQIQPRLLTFPIPRIQYAPINLGRSGLTVSIGDKFSCALTGNDISGAAASLPAGTITGDIFKVIIDVTNSSPSSWLNCTTSNLMNSVVNSDGSSVNLAIADGTTLYAVYIGSNIFSFYQNPEQAFNAGTAYRSGVVYGVGAAVTYNLQCWLSYIGTVGAASTKPNF
jgi:hypothetical protein